jgi:hypothetical protein
MYHIKFFPLPVVTRGLIQFKTVYSTVLYPVRYATVTREENHIATPPATIIYFEFGQPVRTWLSGRREEE